MNFKSSYTPRFIRFLEIHEYFEWKVKIYGISTKTTEIAFSKLYRVKQDLPNWLNNCKTPGYKSHQHATLILHQGEKEFFVVLSSWMDENMLQICAYKLESNAIKLISKNGCVTCVWELAVIWHERNAWVKHILMQAPNPNFTAYLDAQLNECI